MAKVWVDPPSGWQFGFPKIYDSEVDGDLNAWLLAQGCPPDNMTFIRTWSAEAEPGETVCSIRG